MDFVVVGLGLGAFAVLLGLAVRDLGPLFRRIPRDGALPWTEVAERVAWGRRCRAAGLVVAIAGAAVCLITGIALLARVSDSAGMWTVVVALVGALLAVVAWAVRYQSHGTALSTFQGDVEGPTEEGPSGSRPARRSALAGIKSSRPKLSRRAAGTDAVSASDDDREVARPTERRGATGDSAPMGALTVDSSGAMRRTQVGIPSDPASPAPRASRSTQPNTSGQVNPRRTEGTAGEPGDSGRGPGAGPSRR